MSGSAFHRTDLYVLLCALAVPSQPASAASAGSAIVRADCGHLVWMSPASRRARQTSTIVAMCMACRLGRIDRICLLPGTRDELVAEGNDRHRLLELLDRLGVEVSEPPMNDL
jgi:hypothetical protein